MGRRKKRSWDDIIRVGQEFLDPYLKNMKSGKRTHEIECLGDPTHRIKKIYYDNGRIETVEFIGQIRIT